MDFFKKITDNPYQDLYWNIPEEQKRGMVSVIGGNGLNFRTVIKTAEFLTDKFPIKDVRVVLPDSSKSKLPPLENLFFLKTTDAGSFANGSELKSVIDNVDFSLMVGDLSKNSITAKALAEALIDSKKPILVTRDAVDLIAEFKPEQILVRSDLIIFGSLIQWQKIFKSVYYPKILMPSASLLQVAEAFHKFTLSYKAQAILIHDGQILVCQNGEVITLPLAKIGYTTLTVWSGELAAKILALNLYNPNKFLEASVAGMF